MPPGAERAEEGEQLPSQLRVRVLKGDGLVPADKGGKSDPYVKLELLQGATGFRSRQTGKTKTVRETTSPVWEEDVLFAVDRESFRAGATLCIELYDWDAVGRDDYLGDIQIDVLALWPGEQWNLSRGGEWGVEDKKGNVKKKHIAASRVRGHRSLGVVTLLFFLEENAAEKSVIEQEEAEAAKAAQLAAQATAIQTVFRRIMARRTFLQERDSTCWLQGKVRGCLVRARLRRQAGACIQIQAGFRGHQGRHVARQARQAALARATAEAAATAASIEAARQKRAREGPLRALRRLQQSHDQPEQMVPMFLGRSSSMARALMASPRCQDVRPVFDALRDEIARRGIDTYVTRPGEFTPRAVVPRPPHSARSWTPGTWTAGQMRPWTSESLFPPGSTMEWRQATALSLRRVQADERWTAQLHRRTQQLRQQQISGDAKWRTQVLPHLAKMRAQKGNQTSRMTGVLHQARRKQQKQREVVRRRREQIDLKGRKLLKDLEFLFDKKMGRLALRSVGGMLSGALKQEAERVQFLMGRLRANQITRWQYEILYDNHKAMLADMFKEMDSDNSKLLDRGEVQRLASLIGVVLDEEELSSAMAEMDKDGSGEVDFSEFYDWWCSDKSKTSILKPVSSSAHFSIMPHRKKKPPADAAAQQEDSKHRDIDMELAAEISKVAKLFTSKLMVAGV